ncbi:MAG: magnesium/cobalt transporter CorA [Trueperaceae bacterium]
MLPYGQTKKTGLAPGSVFYTGDVTDRPVTINVIEYDEKEVSIEDNVSVQEALDAVDPDHVGWINVNGLHDVGIVDHVSEFFCLHPLTREDIVSVGQRPKVEFYDDYVYIVLRMLNIDKETSKIVDEQVSLILTGNNVISFQERDDGDVFDIIRERIRLGKGRVRRMKADYLVYALMDVIVDHYFVMLEHYAEEIEKLEEELAEQPNRSILERINRFKREMIFLRKAVWPLREVLSLCQREAASQFSAPVVTFLRDVYDHSVQVIDTIESYRDLLTSMLDVYLSSISNRTNETMKVLTIIATIFIPLTFITSIFGMNFEFMPELRWRWGYPMVWLIMILVTSGLLIYFKRRDWI